MRTLEDILSGHHDTAEREILFEDGEWCIYRRLKDRCYIIHRCDKVNRAQNPHHNACHGCSAVMPEPLSGLFRLSEWKR